MLPITCGKNVALSSCSSRLYGCLNMRKLPKQPTCSFLFFRFPENSASQALQPPGSVALHAHFGMAASGCCSPAVVAVLRKHGSCGPSETECFTAAGLFRGSCLSICVVMCYGVVFIQLELAHACTM